MIRGRMVPRCEARWSPHSAKIAPRSEAPGRARRATPGGAAALPHGLAVAVQTGSHDARDGDDKQDGAGHERADEGRSEERGHDGESGRGGMSQRDEEAGNRAGEGAKDEDVEAERLDAGAGLSVGHASPFTACLSPSPVVQVPARASTVIVG